MNGMKNQSFDGHPLTFLNNKFEVDEAIYPLLNILWRKGFKTEYSCQGGERNLDGKLVDAYILFYGDVSAKWFARLIESNGLKCSYSPRGYEWGGGASVHFKTKLIDKITDLVSAVGNPYDSEFQEEIRSAAGHIPKTILTYNRTCPSFAYRLGEFNGSEGK